MQLALALIALITSQFFAALDNDLLLGWKMPGDWLAKNTSLAGCVWLAAAYLYFYSDLIVRRVGVYFYVAAACVLAAEITFVHEHLQANYYAVLLAGTGLVLQILSLVTRKWQLTGHERYSEAGLRCACGLLTIAFFAAALQGLSRVATGHASWSLLNSQAATGVICLVATAVGPSGLWRRLYGVLSIGMVIVSLLTLNALVGLSPYRKAELLAVLIGVGLLLAGYAGRFKERAHAQDAGVTECLALGSALPIIALLIATLYYRFVEPAPSLPDELALVLASVVLLVTGYSWQLRAPTIAGASGLAIYLLVLIGMLAYFPNVTMGAYLAIGGGLLFVAGIVLSIYRERLLAMRGELARREGVFQVLSWR